MSTVTLSARRPAASPSRDLAPANRQQRRWKLTRRGRFIFRGLPVLTLLALVVLGALSFVSPFEAKASDSDQPISVLEVRVKHGETLWDIAYQAEPQADTRDSIERIMDINDLKTTKIEAGQTLLVPVVATK